MSKLQAINHKLEYFKTCLCSDGGVAAPDPANESAWRPPIYLFCVGNYIHMQNCVEASLLTYRACVFFVSVGAIGYTSVGLITLAAHALPNPAICV